MAAPRREDFETLAAPAWPPAPRFSLAGSRAAFRHERPFTVGVEEELLLVHPTSFELVPAVDEVLGLVAGDDRYARELRPSQLETVTRVCATAADACREMAAARRDVVAALDGRFRIVASGTHPWSTAWGPITQGERYRRIADEYTWAAQRSLACGLHVHVAVDDADRALAVFNAMRSYLPELAALTANSPYFEGHDIGMSSIRPKLNDAFPRSGVPPAFRAWDDLVRFTDWGRAGGLFPDGSHFWWELRPHLQHGTLEVRVADTQTAVADGAAVVAVVQALAAWLADRYDRGETLPAHETHWITENAWRAHRYGVRGWLVDLDSGEREPTRARIERLLTTIEPYADALGGFDQLREARVLIAGNGSDRQRYVFERAGRIGLMRWLADRTEAPVAND